MRKTPLFDEHLALGAKMVDFSGWEMPLHYGSQVREHHAVRKGCGMFDVSHMGVVDLTGPHVEKLLRFLLSNDVARMPQPGQAQYSLLLNTSGGISDDLIAYRIGKERFFLVVNAGTRDKDMAWIQVHAPSYDVQVRERTDLAIIAVQGPAAEKHIDICQPTAAGHSLFSKKRAIHLETFHFLESNRWRISRTGYTGENGFELIIPVENCVSLWESLLRTGVVPVGLGARDTLRMEAGLHLYGHDMDGRTNPLVSGLKWAVAWEPKDRDFVGRQALKPLWEQEVPHKRVGLILQGRGVLRNHQKVFLDNQPVGEITSGGYSPTLERGIALARVANAVSIGAICQVDVRGQLLTVQVVRPPFVRHGKPAFRDQ